MIDEELLFQAAERDRGSAVVWSSVLSNAGERIDQYILQLRDNLAQQLGRPATEAEYAQAVMNESGLDTNAFRTQLIKQLLVQEYILSRREDQIRSVREPTEAEITSVFNNARSDFVRPEIVLASMIQVPYGANATTRAAARTLAESLLREINTSGFDQIVMRSVRPDSGYQAGNLPYIPRNNDAIVTLGQTFVDAAFSLRPGQVSGIIEGPQGFQIINVKEYYPLAVLELDDIIQPGSQVTVRAQIRQAIHAQRQQEAFNQAKREIVFEIKTARTYTLHENNIRW